MNCNIKIHCLLLISLLILFLNCSGPGVAGATSETTNGQVSSLAIDENGYPVSNASVFVYEKDALRATDELDIDASTLTNDDGSFTVTGLDSLDYNIEIICANGNRAQVTAVYDTATGLHNIEGVEQITLKAPGRLFGIVEHNPFEKVYVQIYGLHRIVEADSSGYFVFSDIPKGDVRIRIATDTGFVVAEQDSFGVKASESTNCGNYSTASSIEIEKAIIRNFLDVNGLWDIEVDSVAKGSHKHYYLLNCDNMGIDSITPELCHLRLKTLSLSDNSLIALPNEIGKLVNLDYLDISGNHIKLLPESIGSLESVEILDMGYNDLLALPESIINLENIESLYINGNKLHDLSSHIRTWIDYYTMDGSWEESQR